MLGKGSTFRSRANQLRPYKVAPYTCPNPQITYKGDNVMSETIRATIINHLQSAYFTKELPTGEQVTEHSTAELSTYLGELPQEYIEQYVKLQGTGREGTILELLLPRVHLNHLLLNYPLPQQIEGILLEQLSDIARHSGYTGEDLTEHVRGQLHRLKNLVLLKCVLNGQTSLTGKALYHQVQTSDTIYFSALTPYVCVYCGEEHMSGSSYNPRACDSCLEGVYTVIDIVKDHYLQSLPTPPTEAD